MIVLRLVYETVGAIVNVLLVPLVNFYRDF